MGYGVIMDINHIWGVFEIQDALKSIIKNKERQEEEIKTVFSPTSVALYA